MGERAYRELPKPCKRSEMQPGLCDTHNCWAWSTQSEVCLEYRAQVAEARVDELDYDFRALSIHAKALVSDRAALTREVEQLRALVREASPAMMDRREAHPEWMRQAETTLARERKGA